MKHIWITIFFLIVSFSHAQNWQGDPYALDTCALTGEPLGGMGEPYLHIYKNREIRFCCNGCIGDFEEQARKNLKIINNKMLKRQLPYYPMTTCIVSGKKLGKMGKTINYIYKNRLVRFCCKGCIKKFKKNPKKYITKLNKRVIAKQKINYKSKTCPVSGKILGKKTFDYVYGNRLVRLCCPNCVESFRKNLHKIK